MNTSINIGIMIDLSSRELPSSAPIPSWNYYVDDTWNRYVDDSGNNYTN